MVPCILAPPRVSSTVWILSKILIRAMQYDKIWCHRMQYDAIPYNTIQHDKIWYNIIQYGIIWYEAILKPYNRIGGNIAQHDTIWYNAMQHDTIRCPTRFWRPWFSSIVWGVCDFGSRDYCPLSFGVWGDIGVGLSWWLLGPFEAVVPICIRCDDSGPPIYHMRTIPWFVWDGDQNGSTACEPPNLHQL